MLIGNYNVESDSMQVIISERHINTKNRHVYYRPEAYFGNLEMALKWLRNQDINKKGMKDVGTLLKDIEESNQMIKELVDKRGYRKLVAEFGENENRENHDTGMESAT
jgi:hypothetical protein